jgi:hypothetical protein
MAKKSVNAGISAALRGNFDINKYKKSRNLDNSNFKPQEIIPVSEAIRDVLSIRGIPHGHITLLRGHSDTGKSTLMIDIAKNCQKMNILPVFIITEMKWNWKHVIDLGFEAECVYDSDGNPHYEGFFLYVDRSSLDTIEDVATFIMERLADQKKGELPYDLCFFWDSVGSINCQQGITSNSFNNEWSAGAISRVFGNMVNQQIVLSRKQNMTYTNSLVCVNKIWVAKAANSFSQPKMMNKGGMCLWYDASMIITFGNVQNSGVAKLKATKAKKAVEFGKITNVQIDKFHATEGVFSKGNVVMTQHGFISNDPKAIELYKKQHSSEWLAELGASSDEELTIVQEEDNTQDIIKNLENLLDEL